MSTTAPAHAERLPLTVEPRHYEIELAPDIDSASFEGVVRIDADIVSETATIELHAADLDIREVTLERDGTVIESRHEHAEAAERLIIHADEPLGAGDATITVRFAGTLNDQLRGFYRSTYSEDGQQHTIATTQFQSTDARRAFPCWDEPAFKATFQVTLVVPSHLLAISNTAEVSREPRSEDRVAVTFAATMKMSTYLVAFVVGPLEATEPVDVDGVPVRVIHRPGRGEQAAFALDVAAHALRYFADYYDIAYPSDKVDLVAIPDFAFGAMENLGCVTFREVLLLVDPSTASQPELQRVADVVNHELAHMWFGDLVTMQWWEGIWLNEAFATFMETSCSAAYRPDWKVWTSFGRARSAAFTTDALASTRPIEYPVVTAADAEDMFDVLTYEKGAAVVRMLERYLGAVTFRDGVRHYLRKHSYANTRTTDLWDALEEISGEPVRAMMDGWILEGGFPLVTATAGPHGITVSQRHFTLDPDAADGRTWIVPVRLQLRRGTLTVVERILLDTRSRTLTIDADELLSANAEGAGFYRVETSEDTIAEVARNGPGDRSIDERHSLVDDTWALVVAGKRSAEDFLTLVSGFDRDEDLTVWTAIAGGLARLARLFDTETAAGFSRRVMELTAIQNQRLGREPDPDDDDRTRELRATLLRLRGTVAADPDTIESARSLLDHADPTLAAAALAVVSHHGTRHDYDRFLEVFHNATDSQTEQRHLKALADFPDPDLVVSILEGTLDGTVRSQDAPYLILRGLANRHAAAQSWEFVETNWDQLTATIPANSIGRMLEGITSIDDAALAASIDAFLRAHPVPQGEKQIAQHRERMALAVALRGREQDRLRTVVG